MRRFALRSLLICLTATFAAITISAQSSDQAFPTAVTASEVTGVIKARDIGDSRVTSYFYTFSGDQGDMFVNVVSKNFNGDIDIFIADGLRPLSKIVVYSDTSETETGRVIYLRKPEKLILRVEGRTPNDDPATFRLKFAGSFVAAAETDERQLDLPDVKLDKNTSGIQVNSVGTIVAVTPKPKRTPKPPPIASVKKPESAETEKRPGDDKNTDANSNENSEARNPTDLPKENPKKIEVIVSDNMPASTTEAPEVKKTPPSRTRTRKPPTRKRIETKDDSEAKVKVNDSKNAETAASENAKNANETKADQKRPAVSKNPSRTRRTPKPPETSAPDPLENIHLVIEFKDGSRIQKAMTEVFRFTVDHGILTVIYKDGSIGRYPIVDVLKTTIE
ncbi:MAG: hypothetical protein ABI999_01875 [Acidobacteriota bacterium]